jgi:hypothetical protein
MCVGDWYSGKFNASGSSTGSFNWIDFTPNGGGSSELAEILAGAGQCNLAITNNVGQPGGMQSLEIAWNSRFGLYKKGQGNNPSLSSSAPDFTGHSYTTFSWIAGRNAFSDFLTRRDSNDPYQGDSSTDLKNIENQYNITLKDDLKTSGSNRRLVTAPLVDCDGWAGSQTLPIVNWACVLMLHPIDQPGDIVSMEYRGLSNLANSPCATFGIPGGTAGPLVAVLVQ